MFEATFIYAHNELCIVPKSLPEFVMDPTGFSDLFEDSVQISQEELSFKLNPCEVDEPQEANKVLLGKIISKHKYGKAAIQGSLKMSWNAIKGWKWKELEEGLIQFSFANRDDALNVLARRPWFICGSLIVIMPWPAWLTPAEIKFDKTPMWVNVESIPPFYWNLSNLKEMAAKASPVYELPMGIEDAVGMSTLRFRATIDLNSPMFSGFFLRRQKLKDLWIQYRYEKLPKLCFKCGILNHDQSMCFKAPTIVKDAQGNFYPMYGVWLKNDAKEKSTFTAPLAKWFQDWVLQKQLGKDPTLRNQFKIHKALQHAENDELRESRLQLPSKRRIVEDADDTPGTNSTNIEAVITQLPLVNLPGIGEFAPFGNNAKRVVIQDLIDAAPPNDANSLSGKQGRNETLNRPPLRLEKETEGSQVSIIVEGKKSSSERHDQTNQMEYEESQGTKSTYVPSIEGSHCHKMPKPNGLVSDSNHQAPTYSSSPLGSQANPVKWPAISWTHHKGRELVMGSLTIDKYHREPTLFNPLNDIDDFRVGEHLQGPRKRRASDGIRFYPSTQGSAKGQDEIQTSGTIQRPKEISTTTPSKSNVELTEPNSTVNNPLYTPPPSHLEAMITPLHLEEEADPEGKSSQRRTRVRVLGKGVVHQSEIPLYRLPLKLLSGGIGLRPKME
ncbi:hypothetical protein G4B88_014962 [Cannabis sativa]|uniref:DUF4283 domain-containing protein n=1 Tax=Cannabis sativa TaxID=3483 RepID=A0A7J6F091_CANSA|nr:hypothetical protein G4B88_014962 [Cannabis sativa]